MKVIERRAGSSMLSAYVGSEPLGYNDPGRAKTGLRTPTIVYTHRLYCSASGCSYRVKKGLDSGDVKILMRGKMCFIHIV